MNTILHKLNNINSRRTILLLFFAVPIFLHAQTADIIEELLKTKNVSFQQAAWFILEAAGHSGSYNSSSQAEAFRYASGKRWVSNKTEPSRNITLAQVSLLIMRAFDMRGGPIYSMFKTPHYAYREMIYQDIIQGRTAPGMIVSGDILLYLVGRVLYQFDDDPWELPQEPEIPVMLVVPDIFKEEEREFVFVLTMPDGTLTERLLWLSSWAEDGKAYTLELDDNESLDTQNLFYDNKKVDLIIRGDSARRTLSLNGNGYMFDVGPGVTLVLENNVTITGRNENASSLIKVSGGSLIVRDNVNITGNNAVYGGAVNLLSGTFSMSSGTISANSAIYGGAVYVAAEGTFTLTGGTISENNAGFYGGAVHVASEGTFIKTGGTISGNTAGYYGGGVCISGGTLNMRGGTVSGNSAGSGGGGVYVYYNGSITKTGGTIYGSDRDNLSNAVRDNTGVIMRAGRGHAVYASGLYGYIIKTKETTTGQNDNITMSYNNGIPVSGGSWD